MVLVFEEGLHPFLANCRIQASFVGVTPVDKSMILMRLKYTLGLIFLIAECAVSLRKRNILCQVYSRPVLLT